MVGSGASIPQWVELKRVIDQKMCDVSRRRKRSAVLVRVHRPRWRSESHEFDRGKYELIFQTRQELRVEAGPLVLGSRRLHTELFTGMGTDEHVPLGAVFEFSNFGYGLRAACHSD